MMLKSNYLLSSRNRSSTEWSSNFTEKHHSNSKWWFWETLCKSDSGTAVITKHATLNLQIRLNRKTNPKLWLDLRTSRRMQRPNRPRSNHQQLRTLPPRAHVCMWREIKLLYYCFISLGGHCRTRVSLQRVNENDGGVRGVWLEWRGRAEQHPLPSHPLAAIGPHCTLLWTNQRGPGALHPVYAVAVQAEHRQPCSVCSAAAAMLRAPSRPQWWDQRPGLAWTASRVAEVNIGGLTPWRIWTKWRHHVDPQPLSNSLLTTSWTWRQAGGAVTAVTPPGCRRTRPRRCVKTASRVTTRSTGPSRGRTRAAGSTKAVRGVLMNV